MLRTVQCACTLPKAEADALNAESGRIYTDMLVQHYRLYRKEARLAQTPEWGTPGRCAGRPNEAACP